MADESLSSTSPRPGTAHETGKHSACRPHDSLRFPPLPVKMASVRQYHWMGRLDNICIVALVHSFHYYPPPQSVLPSRRNPLTLRTADCPSTVVSVGLGRDIWTVPFDNITLMFKV